MFTCMRRVPQWKAWQRAHAFGQLDTLDDKLIHSWSISLVSIARDILYSQMCINERSAWLTLRVEPHCRRFSMENARAWRGDMAACWIPSNGGWPSTSFSIKARRWLINSSTSCCRLLEKSACPFATTCLNIRGRIPERENSSRKWSKLCKCAFTNA